MLPNGTNKAGRRPGVTNWSIEDKVVLVTGGNSGIGMATAEELARRGARVTITARDEDKGREAADRIRIATGAEVAVGNLDLSRLSSVRSFARGFVGEHQHLDVLINNAGVMAANRRETSDGFEWTFVVNYLGPFLLTNLLIDRLVASAPSRIITVSSENYRTAKKGLDLDDLQMEKGFSPSKAYAASKLANILFTVELDRRFGSAGVTARALHPGVVATSFGKGPDSPKMMGLLMTGLKPFLRKPARGAATSVYLATAESSSIDAGIYWSNETPKDALAIAVDEEAAAQLWSASERMVGLSA